MSRHRFIQLAAGAARLALATLLLSGLVLLPRPQPVLATLSFTDQGSLGMAAVRDGALAWGRL